MPRRSRNSGVPFTTQFGERYVGKSYKKRNRGSYSVWTFTGVVLKNLNIRRSK